MANVDRTRKLLVRTALVTSSTIATLVGAQNLALLDGQQTEPIPIPTAEPTAIILSAAPTIEIEHTAPTVTILRRAGQAGPIQPAAIQPPSPVQVAPPQPMIVQGEAPPPVIIQQPSAPSSQTRSSR